MVLRSFLSINASTHLAIRSFHKKQQLSTMYAMITFMWPWPAYHLHVALACLYCSADNSSKMHWYSASAWEHHTQRHIQDNLSIHPDDPTFYQQFSEAATLPSTSKLASAIPQTINIQESGQEINRRGR